MRKLFSFMLIAVGLLISGQAKAGNCVVTVGGEVQTELTDLKTALNAIATNDGGVYTDEVINIKVTGDADITPNNLSWVKKVDVTNVSDKITFSNNKLTFNGNQKITIDLGDNNTISGKFFSFVLEHGKLEFTGKGTLKTTYSAIDAMTEFPDFLGDPHSNQGLVYLYGSNNCNDADYSSIIIGENVSVLAPFSFACAIMNNGTKVEGSDKYGSFGAKFVVNGYLSSLFGITVSGNIQHLGCDDAHSNIPEFVVGPNGTVISEGDGIYAAGYCRWIIQGHVVGSCGMYVKSGIIVIEGNAKIEGIADTYEEPQPYGNGTQGGDGCGIVFDTKEGYAKGMEITIKDNATIIASNGNALYEVKTDAEQSGVSMLKIEGGNFEVLNDDYVCLKTTEEVKEMVVQNGTITGGVFNTDEVEDYVNHENTVITFYSTEDGEDKWTIGNHPADQWKGTIDAAGEGDYVQMKSENAHIEEIPANTTKSIEYLAMLGKDKVIINEGATLIVSAVVLNEEAVIVVKPKATLKIKSSAKNKGGLISTSSDNLIIEADAESYGQLLIDPQVTFNTTPMATVELTSSSYANGSSDYAYQRFGIPMGAQLESIESEDDRTVFFTFYDYANKGWKHAGYLNPKTPAQQQEPLVLSAMNKPFGYYQMIVNHPTPGTKVTFKGKLAGNTSPVLTAPASQEWVGFANSYVAEMSMSALLSALDVAQTSNVAIYRCATLGNTHSLTWTPINEEETDLDAIILKPMEAFLIKPADPSKPFSLPLNYQTMIWGE